MLNDIGDIWLRCKYVQQMEQILLRRRYAQGELTPSSSKRQTIIMRDHKITFRLITLIDNPRVTFLFCL